MIEKRYRTNLNDKIAALRDSVPSLRATEKISGGEVALDEDLQGLEAAHKLNKVARSHNSSCSQSKYLPFLQFAPFPICIFS
jgi:hypothetical protein